MARLFEWQVGFVGPPGYFDASPTDFLRIAPLQLGVQARSLAGPLPPTQSAGAAQAIEEAILETASALSRSGADLVALVGTNWSPLGLRSYDDTLAFCARLEAGIGARSVSAPKALIDSLRAMGAARIGINATYSAPDWRDRLADYFTSSGLSVAFCGNYVDLGLFSETRDLLEQNGFFPESFAEASICRVWDHAPDVDAIVATGIPSFVDKAGRTRRMLHLTPDLESCVPVPIVATDTALYQAILRELGLSQVLPGLRMSIGG